MFTVMSNLNEIYIIYLVVSVVTARRLIRAREMVHAW